ncbi:hypothetical protein DPMN_116786 [Dreissena polymorpha]|uniref:Uncharacterized protein n=1 Tax=Dreissena polymorpha TaxID=45954 RepID=A0A9D4QUK8_DREPO|nr:hypothetical protein DPMN_116786 [Dreissena polymorpha]
MKMSSIKVVKKTLPANIRRQTTWIRSEEKLKQWHRGSTSNQPPRLLHRTSGVSSTERKSDVTRSGRLSDGTVNTSSTGSSSDHYAPQLQDVEDIESKESIEKCLKWMETLPNKFSGMHIYVQPTTTDTIS